eukprot:TRINITY_DN123907_c0_g1_i1.p1 TRINITY_DN123907_c0_g1~~TRINITY_DN123907_c0_g1_i1.p1  ORF type:complete len:104 (+),score=5.97 TRINITY_DN123907_c0_g1_i1:36-347(+)
MMADGDMLVVVAEAVCRDCPHRCIRLAAGMIPEDRTAGRITFRRHARRGSPPHPRMQYGCPAGNHDTTGCAAIARKFCSTGVGDSGRMQNCSSNAALPPSKGR